VTYMKVENVPETVLLVETFVDDLLSYRPWHWEKIKKDWTVSNLSFCNTLCLKV
jgi:hypothetical protein